MNTRWKEAARETAVLLGMWAVAACGLMFIAQRNPTASDDYDIPTSVSVIAAPLPAVPSAIAVMPVSWRPDGATMLAQAKAAHRVYAPQSQVASRRPLRQITEAKAGAMKLNDADRFARPLRVKVIGSTASFDQWMKRVFVYPGNTLTCLNFALDYRTSVVAVIKPANYHKFPDLQKLVGKNLVFTGKIVAYRDPAAQDGWRPEIELTSPDQIQILK